MDHIPRNIDRRVGISVDSSTLVIWSSLAASHLLATAFERLLIMGTETTGYGVDMPNVEER